MKAIIPRTDTSGRIIATLNGAQFSIRVLACIPFFVRSVDVGNRINAGPYATLVLNWGQVGLQ